MKRGVAFFLRPGASFQHCDGCPALLAGVMCWQWRERGKLRAACRVCFPAAEFKGATDA